MRLQGRVAPLYAPLLLLGAVACDPVTPRTVFERDVAPLLEARCSAGICHGVPEGSEAAGDVVDWERLYFLTDSAGRLLDRDAAYLTAKRVIDPDSPAFSTLARKGLPTSEGGLPHAGGTSFSSRRDPEYVALLAWIASEKDGGEEQPPLDGNEQLFADTVEPMLQNANCMNASCHGVDAAVPFRLDPGIDGVRSPSQIRANYEQARRMLSLDGDPSQSRLLRKALPLHQGGIAHKGGNTSFLFPANDPRGAALMAWTCAERAARAGAPCIAPGESPIRGFVFVRGPVAAEDNFDLDVFVPGTDLYYARIEPGSLVPVEITNLTASLHDAPADVRDPAVDPTGQRVAFSMRTSAEGGHELWELELATGTARALTSDAGMANGWRVTNRDPTWAPDGHVWFVSTRDGLVADRGSRLDADLFELDPASGVITRRTRTPHIERKPIFFVTGEEAGDEVGFSALREAVGGQRRGHPFRFPPSLETEYHQHFGITPDEDLFFDMRETADGRYLTVIGDLDNAWPGGRLGVVDRNFGPEIPGRMAGADPALPFYAAPLSRLDDDANSTGVTATYYQDPVGLPDGRLLSATAVGPIDLADPAAPLDLRIEVLSLVEDLDGNGPRIAGREVLVDEPGVADFDPEPVYVKKPAELHTPTWDAEQSTGILRHQGLPLIDAILTQLPPAGVKTERHDIRWVRIVEALPTHPANAPEIAAAETRAGLAGATTLSLSGRAPARIIAELPLASDGTFHVELPAWTAFRLQALDDDKWSVGTLHNRWYYLAPGQVMTQGASTEAPDIYSARCAACHGAQNGDPTQAFIKPDILTTASVTLSRYEAGNPRRPLPPLPLGEDTAFGVDVLADVQPLLVERCAGCHGGAEPAAGLSLTAAPTQHFSDAYESLLAPGSGSVGGRRYVADDDGSARRSFLMEQLTGRELDAPRRLPSRPPTEATDHRGLLADDELLLLVRWIELGATWRGSAP
ncbi:MAG: hypothetical protein IT382_12310 [Deltaproteobacteria bacterium]|nr:hypothetical protein [Deltaproteobacteria bacterium]